MVGISGCRGICGFAATASIRGCRGMQFSTVSDVCSGALETGWYNSQLYYDRGVVYERLNNFKQAKKEYKKAKKNGYADAERALEACKQHEKEYKRRMKNKRKK